MHSTYGNRVLSLPLYLCNTICIIAELCTTLLAQRTPDVSQRYSMAGRLCSNGQSREEEERVRVGEDTAETARDTARDRQTDRRQTDRQTEDVSQAGEGRCRQQSGTWSEVEQNIIHAHLLHR
ncbi:hypothetical protein DFP73DRAFT_312184 [Morchella snyderi]|nr:hypothetical protein DFP73DRAFT_312184 [Morchella snyderi]